MGVSSDLSYQASPKVTLRLLNSYRDWHDVQLFQDTLQTSANALGILNDLSSKAQSHELQLISPKGRSSTTSSGSRRDCIILRKTLTSTRTSI